MAHITSGVNSRVGDHMIALGLERYENSSKSPLWVWSIRSGCSGPILARICDPSVSDLHKMKRIIEEHIELLSTDGGRIEKESALTDTTGGER